jgi:LysM repeat protein
MSVQKARLLIEDASGAMKTRLDCWFNPTSFTRRSGASWKTDKTLANGERNPAYLGGEGEAISLTLILHAGDGKTGTQLVSAVNQLLKLVQPTVTPNKKFPRQKRPPKVQLQWGAFTSVLMTAKSIDVTYELFDVGGVPLRASVSLALGQFQSEPGQGAPKKTNPTTRATQSRLVHVVAPGDTLHLIAHRHLADPTRWSEIAAFNELGDPLQIRAGDVLVVPTDNP